MGAPGLAAGECPRLRPSARRPSARRPLLGDQPPRGCAGRQPRPGDVLECLRHPSPADGHAPLPAQHDQHGRPRPPAGPQTGVGWVHAPGGAGLRAPLRRPGRRCRRSGPGRRRPVRRRARRRRRAAPAGHLRGARRPRGGPVPDLRLVEHPALQRGSRLRPDPGGLRGGGDGHGRLRRRTGRAAAPGARRRPRQRPARPDRRAAVDRRRVRGPRAAPPGRRQRDDPQRHRPRSVGLRRTPRPVGRAALRPRRHPRHRRRGDAPSTTCPAPPRRTWSSTVS